VQNQWRWLLGHRRTGVYAPVQLLPRPWHGRALGCLRRTCYLSQCQCHRVCSTGSNEGRGGSYSRLAECTTIQSQQRAVLVLRGLRLTPDASRREKWQTRYSIERGTLGRVVRVQSGQSLQYGTRLHRAEGRRARSGRSPRLLCFEHSTTGRKCYVSRDIPVESVC